MRDASTNYSETFSHKGRKWVLRVYERSGGVLSIVGSPLYCTEDVVAHVAVVRTAYVYCASGTERSYVICFGRILISAMAPFVWLVRGINAHVPPTIRSTCPAWLIAALRIPFDIFRLLCLPSPLRRFFSFCSPPIPRRLRYGNVCQRK